MASYLEDNNNNKSSKRLWGSILLTKGMLLSIVLCVLAIFFEVKTPDFLFRVVELDYVSGCGLLAAGVIETFGRKNV